MNNITSEDFPIMHTFYCQESLRDLFLDRTLIHQWASLYPKIFDGKDVELALGQRKVQKSHFYEWFTAIQMFHLYGYKSLIEQYEFKNHPAKKPILKKLFDQDVIDFIEHHPEYGKTQCPDLLVYKPDHSECFFIEVKGNKDRWSGRQKEFFNELKKRSGKDVRLVHVKLL